MCVITKRLKKSASQVKNSINKCYSQKLQFTHTCGLQYDSCQFCFNEDFKIHALGTDLTLLTEIYDGDVILNIGYI